MPIAPPFLLIRDQFMRGEIIPFLGAGASLCGRPIDEAGKPRMWESEKDPFLPNGMELGKWLAVKCNFPEAYDNAELAKIASYFEVRAQRQLLRRNLSDIFSKSYSYGVIHEFLAESPKPLLIVTTNYDDLLEKAFQAKGRAYHLVTHPERAEYAGCVTWWPPGAVEPIMKRPNELPLSLQDVSIIYKMHGTASALPQWSSFVITEEDYVRFLARMTLREAVPKRFMLQFMRSPFLFLGYGLKDWNFRVMLETLRDRRGLAEGGELTAAAADGTEDAVFPSWAIQNSPSELERTLWEYRNVQVFDMDLQDFVAELRNNDIAA